MEGILTFSSPVATAEFSKFAGILSAALSQHHFLEFEIAQLEFHHLIGASLIAQLVKNPPAMWETPVQFLGWEDPLEKG